MEIHVEESHKLRRASASIRDAGVIVVKVPRRWPKALKASAITELVERLEKKDRQEKALLAKAALQPAITLENQADLEAYVRLINEESFRVPLGKIQIGYARYNHLAQVNLRTKTMTVSRYCLNAVPAQALRYLIIHELAHYFESGHGPKFWTLVARHVPDYKLQSRIMKAFHHQSVIHEAQSEALHVPPAAQKPTPTASKGRAGHSAPDTKPRRRRVAVQQPEPGNNHKTGKGLPGLVKQLTLLIRP